MLFGTASARAKERGAQRMDLKVWEFSEPARKFYASLGMSTQCRILEKGLTVKGSSRSGRSDYEELLRLYEENPDITDYLEKIVGAQIHVRSIKDIIEAFEMDIHKMSGKTIMIWDK